MQGNAKMSQRVVFFLRIKVLLISITQMMEFREPCQEKEFD
jgi:hypothetical protein